MEVTGYIILEKNICYTTEYVILYTHNFRT